MHGRVLRRLEENTTKLWPLAVTDQSQVDKSSRDAGGTVKVRFLRRGIIYERPEIPAEIAHRRSLGRLIRRMLTGRSTA